MSFQSNMRLKLIMVGDYGFLPIPEELIQRLGWGPDDLLTVEIDQKTGQLIISRLDAGEHSEVDEAFKAEVNEFIQDYRTALQNLAKK